MGDGERTPGPQPLAGHRVVELGTSVAAPYATWILGALGAEVIKVERPGTGDDARHWGPPFFAGTATIFHAINANKRSVAVDLKDEAARDKLRRFIVRRADAVVQNLRPGTTTRLGLDAETLTRLAPRLIYCSIWAFGATGPARDKPGYDPLMQAQGGIMSINGEGPDRPPARVGASIIDMGTGMWCAIGILTALLRRAETGRGLIVDTSLFETALGWMTFFLAGYHGTGAIPVPRGSGIQGLAPYEAFACTDGWLMIAAPNEKLFEALAHGLGHPEWLADPRYATNPARVRNRDALHAELAPIFLGHTRGEAQVRLEAAGVPCAPVHRADEVVADPQTRALGLIQSVANFGLPLVGLPLSFDRERPPLRGGAPDLASDDRLLEEE